MNDFGFINLGAEVVPTVTDTSRYLTAFEVLTKEGVPAAEYVNVADYAVVESKLAELGYINVISDNGVSLGYTKLFQGLASGTTTTGATQTAAIGSTLTATTSTITGTGGEAVLTMEMGETASGVLAPALVTPLQALGAIACGIGLGFAGEAALEEIYYTYFTDEYFDWKTDSVGGKIYCYIDNTGRTFFNDKFVNRVKDRFFEIGSFDTEIIPDEIVQEPKQYHITSVSDLLKTIPGKYQKVVEKIIETWGTSAWFTSTSLGYYVIFKEENNYTGIGKNLSVYILPTDRRNVTTYTGNTYTLQNYEDTTKDNTKIYYTSDGITHVYNLNSTGEGYVGTGATFNWPTLRQGTTKGIGQVGDVVGAYYNSVTDRVTTTTSFPNPYSTYGVDEFGVYTNFGTPSEGVPGVEIQPEAQKPERDRGVRDTYQILDDNKVNRPRVDIPNKTSSDEYYVPLKVPDITSDPITQPQDDTLNQPNTQPQTDYLIDTQNDFDIKTDTPGRPIIVTPTEDIGKTEPEMPIVGIGLGNGLVSVYNPTQEELKDFSRFLWSTDFIDTIKKLFQDPFSAVVGLHVLPVIPDRGPRENIVCGYVNSQVQSNTVVKQFVNWSSGKIKINNYFDNVRDYNNYTKLEIFLPFIGIQTLDVNQFMGKSIRITYKIDVLTGACSAMISAVDGNNYDNILYTFNGSCGMQLPISGGSYSGVMTALAGAAASAVTGSGVGVALSLMNMKASVNHSGGFNGTTGWCSNLQPYLIITRCKPNDAGNYTNFYGSPLNLTVTLGTLTGYTKIKDVHVENIERATIDELNLIEQQLKEGIIL